MFISRMTSVLPTTNRQAVRPKFGTEDSTSIVVDGQASVSKKPDTMGVYLSIQDEGTDKDAITRSVNQRVENLNNALDALNLPKLKKSSRISDWSYVKQADEDQPTSPRRRAKKTAKSEGVRYHVVSYNLSLTQKGIKSDDMPRYASQISEAADKVGAQFNGPSYGLSKSNAALREAIKKAMQSALEKARSIAAEFGLVVNPKPVSVSEGNADPYGGGRKNFAAARTMAASVEAIGGGYSEGSFSVQDQEFTSPNFKVAFSTSPKPSVKPSAANSEKAGPSIHPLSPEAAGK